MSRNGYKFKGYYSQKNGKGTRYYDSNMKSKHKWDQSKSTTIYAYWEKKETRYSSDSSIGDKVYVDIVSITPKIGIYPSGYDIYTDFVCKCKTSAGNTVWIYIEVLDYWEYFDDTASGFTDNSGYSTKYFSKAKRVHGVVVKADNITNGLSDDIGRNKVIKFSSVG